MHMRTHTLTHMHICTHTQFAHASYFTLLSKNTSSNDNNIKQFIESIIFFSQNCTSLEVNLFQIPSQTPTCNSLNLTAIILVELMLTQLMQWTPKH